jgi:hypothetical protein
MNRNILHAPPLGAIIIAILNAITTSAGCAAHASLGVIPDGSAPLDDRAEAYERLRPQTPLNTSPPYAANPYSGAYGKLALNDGTVISYPTDLAAAVPSGSATMEHARRAEDLEQWNTIIAAVGGTLATFGLAGEMTALVLTAPLASDPNAPAPIDTPEGSALMTGALVSAGVGVVGALSFIPVMIISMQAFDERHSAFAAYDADLKRRLALKPKKSGLVDQWDSTATSGSAAPPPPPVNDPASAASPSSP